jgi:hypothetical protein
MREIRELHEIFRDFFHYYVEEWNIPSGKNNFYKIGSFTEDNDGEDNLVIIYYGGHAYYDLRRHGTVWVP